MKIIPALLALVCVSCANFEMHVKKERLNVRPNRILIGPFERRTLKYNPFVVKDFRDGLRYELFTRGYKAELLMEGDTAAAPEPSRQQGGPEKPELKDKNAGQAADRGAVKPAPPEYFTADMIRAACAAHSADLFIQGALSEEEIGEITDIRTSTLVTFQIYDKKGEMIGEARYATSDTLSDARTIKAVTGLFASRLNSRLR